MNTAIVSRVQEESNPVGRKCHEKDFKRLMAELCKEAEDDEKFGKLIKSRGFWDRLFSNNSRDLAKLGMKQTDLIRKLQQALQSLMGVVKDEQERERRLVGLLDKVRASTDSLGGELVDSVKKTIRAIFRQDAQIARVESKVAAHGNVTDSKAAAQKCVNGILEYCESVMSVSVDEFRKRLNETVKVEFFDKNIALRNEDKQRIARALSSAVWKKVKCEPGLGSEYDLKTTIEQELERLSPEGDVYTKYRDELVAIIDEFVKRRDEVDPQGRSIEKLVGARKRLLESQFEIALIGEFQGGKSTTFNALCGGREISPRGLGTGGVKTSAVVITAQNIAGGETRDGMSEWAEMKWLSRADIQRRIAVALDLEGTRNLSVSRLEEALKRKWSALDRDDTDALDLLQVATLQLQLLKSPDFDSYTARSVVAIDEFQKYVQFPKDWQSRWGKGHKDAGFTDEECLFSALDSVLVRIHSDDLQRLGCRITDCPGLFVNRWDTDRALEVMSRSNAVWYLLNGQKEIGPDQVRILQLIRPRQPISSATPVAQGSLTRAFL